MKFKKIISAVISAAMCFSMFALNVSADEAQPELINMSAPINGNIMDINQVPQGNESFAQAENFNIAYFDKISEVSEVSEVSDIEQTMSYIDYEAVAEAYSSQDYLKLSELGIIEIWLGKTYSSPESDATQWRQVKNYLKDYGKSQSDVTVSIDATGYSYIKFVSLKWGYTNRDQL